MKTETDEATQIQFTMNMIKRIFSVEEIRTCIFPDKNSTIRSKRDPFEARKIQDLKSEYFISFFFLNFNN